MATITYRPPLAVYVVWHLGFSGGQELADCIFSTISRKITDPLSRGIGIPVYFRSHGFSDTGKPKPITLEEAEHTAVVVLISDEMVADGTWSTYVHALYDQIQNSGEKKHLLYPVSISKHAFNVGGNIPAANFIRVHEVEREVLKRDFLLTRLVHELCRLLYNKERISKAAPQSPAPIKIFLSHAKRDGKDLALELKQYIDADTGLETFFDADDIAAGFKFPDELAANVEQSVLLVLHTDAYSSREWCRREVLLAKKHNCPIIVLNAFKNGESRSFPYMANVPNHRLKNLSVEKRKPMLQRIVFQAMLETLRFKHQELMLRSLAHAYNLKVDNDAVFALPPEMITVHNHRDSNHEIVIYPDPPLGDDEMELLTEYKPSIQFITPSYLPALS